jgi:hypothetical protein
MRPVSTISIALALPTTRVSRWVPPAAEIDLRLAKSGVVGGDDDVAHHGQLASPAQRIPGDGGDDRLAAAGDLLPAADEVALERRHEVQGFHFLDVRARCKRPLGPGQHHDRDLGISLERAQRLIELRDQLVIERVEHLRPIERGQADRPARLDQDGLVRHGCWLPKCSCVGGCRRSEWLAPPAAGRAVRLAASVRL